LPINSARKLENLEQDPIVQQTVAAIIELSKYKLSTIANALGTVLENVSKVCLSTIALLQSAVEQPVPSEVLQSQLFILRLLSACMQHHWKSYRDQSKQKLVDATFAAKTEEAAAAAAATGYIDDEEEDSAGSHSPVLQFIDLPPLDEALVTFILVLMNRFLNHVHLIEEANDQSSTSSDHSTDTQMSNGSVDLDLIMDIYRAAGKVLYYVSASNWLTYYAKIKNSIQVLGAITEATEKNTPEIRMLECCCLTRPRLHMVLSELSPYFLHMKRHGKLLFSRMMRKAIWRWIETYPNQFAEVCASEDRLLGGSEILFDMCSSTADNLRNKAILWPLQTILLVLSPDLLLQAFLDDPSSQNRRTSFLGVLRKSLRSPRTADIAAVCYVDLCKASTYVPPTEDSVLRHIAADIEDDLKDKIWNFARPTVAESVSASLGYTIDVQSLITDYILAQLRLNTDNTLRTIVRTCVEENTPMVFKRALVKSCLAIAQDETRLKWNPTIESMYGSLCSILRKLFLQVIASEFASMKQESYSSQRKWVKKESSVDAHHRVELIQDLLRLFREDPHLALLGDDTDRIEQNAAFMTGLAHLVQHPDYTIHQGAGECLFKLHLSDYIVKWGPKASMMVNFWRISSQAVFALARQMLDNKRGEEGLKSLLDLLIKLLHARNDHLRSNMDIAGEGAGVRERLQASVALEIALLVSLCSPDPEICSDSTRCLGYLCVEAQLSDQDDDPHLSQITLISNIGIYTDLASEDTVFLGRKAQQKRIRKFMRMMSRHTPGNLAAWEEAWKRWKFLTPVVSRFAEETFEDGNESARRHTSGRNVRTPIGRSPSSPQGHIEMDDEKATEWQNYTGFLAALGGCCLTADIENMDIRRYRSSDHISPTHRAPSPNEPSVMVDRFMKEMVDLLVSDNVFIREAVKDTLGSDLSPALYSILFRHLEDFMCKCFDANEEVACGPQHTLFVEQAVLVLKLILDRLIDPGDHLLNIDFGTLIQQFTKYLSRLPTNYVALRIKIKMCHLIEALMSKKEQIVIRNEMRLRNKLLEIMVEWTSDFALQKVEPKMSSIVSDVSQNEKLHRDLDQACLKAIVGILHQLPLQPAEPVRQTDTCEVKSRLFYKYFTFFLKLLNRCRLNELEVNRVSGQRPSMELLAGPSKPAESYYDYSPLKDYTILAMSNLLSANVDAGLKYSLAMGYHEDTRTRTAFMQVLTNILNQGTEFETLAENVVTDRYEKLIDMLVDADMEVAMSLCEVCPATDISGVAEVLLLCFESRNKVAALLKSVIAKEVMSTEQEATLFRSTTMATRILSIYARLSCVDYIRITLQPAMESINSLSDEETTWELDPQKLGPDDDVVRNKQNVIRATEILLNAICLSAPNAPRIFREELSFIVEAVRSRFPEAKYTAVGGFVFLRLFGPSILTPENAGFAKQALPRNKNIRKILLQATRVMQNLANNVLFGAKETHMIVLNDFLTNNIYRVTSFLREISSLPNDNEPRDPPATMRMDQSGYGKLHRYLSDNLERMSRDLAGRRLKTATDTQSLLEWKKTIDRLSNLLAQLGRPPELSQHEINYSRNYAVANGNHHYSEFIRRNSHRDLTAISSQNVFFQGGVSKGGRPVFYVIARNVDAETCDFELLIYYMLRVMEPYLSHPFELLFDLTQFSAACEIPIHWLTQFFQLVFTEMNDYLVTLHLYNPNSHLQRYIRKLPRAITNKLVKRTHFSLSLAELYERISPSEVRLPKETLDIEQEPNQVFFPVTRLTHLRSTIPVMSIELIVRWQVRKQELLYNLNAVLRDIYHISQIEDITALPQSKQEAGGELSFKYERGKASMTLSSTKRDAILALLRYNKQRYETLKPGGINERAVRPSDVPGRLLNMALLNVGSDDPGLRLAAYNLLYSLSLAFQFDIGNQLLNARDLCIPANSTNFVVSISESLAATEIHLTLEFLNECFIGFNKSNEPMRQLCLDYMAPWLRNLSFFCRGCAEDTKQNVSKTTDVLRSLIDMTVARADMYKYVQDKVWKTLARVDDMINPILDAFVQYSVDHGVGSPQAESMADTIVTMSSVAVRGKVISRLRKVIQHTSLRPCRSLTEHVSWPEIAVLLRFILMLSFNNAGPVKLYLPETFHIVSLLAATGPTLTRVSVHELVVNVIHTLCTGMPLSEENVKKLHFVLNDVCDSKSRIYFGITKHHANAFTLTTETMTDYAEPINLSSLENIVRILLDALTIGAPSTDIANMWRARWMGLVTSTAFQFNPAIQPRSFVVLGCLAQDEVDDDLIYQILVALRGALAIFNENDSALIISIMMCLRNIIDNLPANSRYLQSLFWLAIALVQMSHPATFSTAVEFLQSVLRALEAHNMFVHRPMVDVLMEARQPLADIARELDAAGGVNFENHFSFAIAGVLLKGIKNCEPKDVVFDCLMIFLEIDSKRSLASNTVEARTLGYLAALLPIAAKNGALRELMRLAGLDDVDLDSLEFGSAYVRIFDNLEIPDNTTALLLVSLLVNMLNSTENEPERLFLYSFLAEAAVSIPEAFALVYESLLPKMNQIVVSNQNYAVIEAVKNILMTACSEPTFNNVVGRRSQRAYLEDLGFSALGESTFGAAKTNIAVSAQLASKLLDRITE
ncbi:Ras GTPase activating protein ira2, partial [Apophysomyces ossiformis]